VGQLDQRGALFVVDESVRRVQDVDRLEQRPRRARPVADGVRARFQDVTGVREAGVANLQVRVAGVVLGVDALPEVEGEAAPYRYRQPRVLAALPGEGQQGRDPE
jgi:hypothetical protein